MYVLLTKKLPPAQLDLIRSIGWSYDVIESLEIIPLEIKPPVKADDIEKQ